MKYPYSASKKVFSVSKILAVHYFENPKVIPRIAEKKDVWKMIYVDKGVLEAQSEGLWISLKQGEAIFLKPDADWELRASGLAAYNFAIISFRCSSLAMDFFQGKVFAFPEKERRILANIIAEARQVLPNPVQEPVRKKAERKKEAPFGAEQMIGLCLEQLLICLRRSYGEAFVNSTVLHRGLEEGVIRDVLAYLQENIQEKLVFQQVLDQIGISASGLKAIFKEKMGMGVMAYFTKMKIETAKTMIQEGKLNITQIAGFLGYDSIHLFSRRFRQLTGMSPTEYGKSIQSEFSYFEHR